ncbi:hypothetical protein B0H13DRAFT_2394700 [Mycena leptocephala]|nr:hypothetical protein B0H13DRAFT_2394700 [Mycena leptocephala]
MYIVKAVTAFLLASAGIDDSPVKFDGTPMIMEPITGPVKLFNHGFNASLFTFSDAPQLDVFIQRNSPDYPGGFSIWNMKGVGGDRYTFTNQHTGQPLIVNNNYLITKSGAEATEFAVDSSGSGEDVIKLPTKSEVWTATSDGTGTCPIFGRVKLVGSGGSTDQHWKIEPVNVKK